MLPISVLRLYFFKLGAQPSQRLIVAAKNAVKKALVL
jgi:hypothetical protein